MKVYFISLIVLLFMGLSCPLLAQSTKVVGYVNFQKIQKQLPAYAAANDEAETFAKGVMAELNRQQKELRQKYRTSVPKADTAAYYATLRRESQAYSQQVALKQREITQKREQTLAIVDETVRKIVGEVARERGFSGVLDAGAMIYYDQNYDITSVVLNRLATK